MMAQQKDGIDRRQLLLGAPVAGAVAIMPSFGSAGGDTPVMRLYREWRSHWDWLNSSATAGYDEGAFDLLCDKADRMAGEIIKEPSTGPHDTLAKLIAATNDCEGLEGEHTCIAALIEEIQGAVERVV